MGFRRDGNGTEKIDEWLANRGPTMDSCVRTLAFALPQRHLHELHDHRRMIYRGQQHSSVEIQLQRFQYRSCISRFL